MTRKTKSTSIVALLVSMTLVCESLVAQQQQQSAAPAQSQAAVPVVRLSLSDQATSLELHTDTQAKENSTPDAADTLVLCPAPFVAALQPWVEYRRRQGHNIHVISPTANAYGIKRQIRAIAEHGNLKNVLLIGDTPNSNPNSIHYSVPTDYVRAEIVSKYGSEPEIATDNTYADLDDDGLPDLAIGRISVDNAEQLSQQVRKIIAYESAPSGQWQRRINLVAGTGGFGQLSDSVIERTSKSLISELIPAEYTTTMTYASWSSAYCPDPRDFANTTLQRLNEGCLFWVYMGHGHPQRLGYLRTPVGGFPILQNDHLHAVNCTNGNPIALMLACYTGAFDLPADCLAEELMQRPGGPIAVMCGSRVTMPCGMSLLSVGLIEEYFGGEVETLGEMMRLAKRKLVLEQPVASKTDGRKEVIGKEFIELATRSGPQKLQPKSPNAKPIVRSVNELDNSPQYHARYRQMIRMLGEQLSPKGTSLAKEAKEHVHLFHLLGDPLLRVRRPHQIELQVEKNDDASKVVVTGAAPHAGEMIVELAYCRDRFKKRPPRRSEFEYTVPALESYKAIYDAANQRTVSSKTVSVPAGQFRFELEVPDWAKGRCIVRGFLKQEKTGRYAMGASELNLKRR